jgi:hypothetical protein
MGTEQRPDLRRFASSRCRSTEHGTHAAGATYIRAGFAWTAEYDLAFALGFPFLRALVDDHPDDAETDVAARVQRAVGSRCPVFVPARIGLARARALPFVVLNPDGSIRNAALVEQTVQRTDDLSVDEARSIVERAMANPSLVPAVVPECLAILEAIIGPSALAEILLAALEGLTDARRTTAPKLRPFGSWLGFSLLRVPTGEADALRMRMEALLSKAPTTTSVGVSAHQGIEVALQRGIRNATDAVFLSAGPPERIRELVHAEGIQPRFAPQARLLFLGGPELIAFHAANAKKLNADKQPDLFDELGPIRADAVLRFLLLLTAASKVQKQATAWFIDHAPFVRPFLEERAGGAEDDEAKWARAVLEQVK